MTAWFFILGFLFVLLFSFIGFSQRLSQQVDHPRTACQSILFNAQHSMAENLNSLLKLNPLVKGNHALLLATKALTLSNIPGVSQAALLTQTVARFNARALAFAQKSFLLTARIQNSYHKIKLIEFFVKRAPQNFLVKTRRFRLKVKKKKLSSVSTLYFPQEDFSKRQKIYARWFIYWQLLPFDKKLFKATLKPIKDSCAATIVKESNRWIATLSKDKSSWNY